MNGAQGGLEPAPSAAAAAAVKALLAAQRVEHEGLHQGDKTENTYVPETPL